MSKNKHNQSIGSDIERSDERINQTGEVFTPPELTIDMVKEIPIEQLKNPNSRFIDNSAGNGNFIVALKDELVKYHDEQYVLDNMLYAVELMADNHKELCERLGVSTDHPHYVNANALEYDYSFGNPIGIEQYMD
jgi:hypothetical protein